MPKDYTVKYNYTLVAIYNWGPPTPSPTTTLLPTPLLCEQAVSCYFQLKINRVLLGRGGGSYNKENLSSLNTVQFKEQNMKSK